MTHRKSVSHRLASTRERYRERERESKRPHEDSLKVPQGPVEGLEWLRCFGQATPTHDDTSKNERKLRTVSAGEKIASLEEDVYFSSCSHVASVGSLQFQLHATKAPFVLQSTNAPARLGGTCSCYALSLWEVK